MPPIHLHDVGDKYFAIMDGENGQAIAIPKKRAGEIQKLIAERDRIGSLITARLKREGIVTAADDEKTEVIKPGK